MLNHNSMTAQAIYPAVGMDKMDVTGKATAKEVRTLQTGTSPHKANFARKVWLHYYNDQLRQKRVITDEEWRKVRRQIGALEG